jgi:single-strand DNA-binding protein
MSGLNRVVVTGHLGGDPELRALPSGTSVCEFSLAVNSREKKGDEWVDRVDWFTITVWGNQAENAARYLTKGSPVAIDGRLRQEKWETDDGSKRERVKIVAQNVQFLGQRPDPDGSQAAQHAAPAATAQEPAQRQEQASFAPSGATGFDDDIPF